MRYQWQLIEMPTAPLVRLEITIFDRPGNPYRIESFLNVGDAAQLDVISGLASQDELQLAFYGDELRYRFTKVLPHDEQQWQQLDGIINRALAYWKHLPPAQRDFDLAKARFMARYP